jgi:ABC-type transport system substrate-binding protein
MQSSDFEQRVAAAHEAQRILNDETHPRAAFAYMPLYSRNYFNAYNPDLRGIVNSPGYGSDNDWTHLDIHWAAGVERLTHEGETIIKWLWGEAPGLLNPCSASTLYTWNIIDKVLDDLIAVGPYTNADIQWVAENWEVVKWPDAGPMGETYMNFTFWLRQDVFWQDGNPYTAHDAAFNWRFLKDNQIPQYEYMWHELVDVDVIDNYTVTAIMHSEDQLHLYDLSETAALLPPPVWSWLDGKPLAAILEYDPSANTTAPAGAGPWFGAGKGFPGTQLYGTGPFVFGHYDPDLQLADFHQSVSYFQTADEIAKLKTMLFHEIGDINRDGYIDVFDLSALGVAYGQRIGWPGYDPDVDLNSDGIIDGRDLALICYHWGEQKEYP